MTNTKFYDITDVCKMLHTTSRTLRFYEEKGIITSTTIGTSTRRQYTKEQVNHIRNVLVLRTLGLSVKSISQLQQEHCDLKNAILAKRTEIYASIEAKRKEIHLLNDALVLLKEEKIFLIIIGATPYHPIILTVMLLQGSVQITSFVATINFYMHISATN